MYVDEFLPLENVHQNTNTNIIPSCSKYYLEIKSWFFLILQVWNLNGGFKIDIDEVGNVLYMIFLMNSHNSSNAPWRVINGISSEPPNIIEIM